MRPLAAAAHSRAVPTAISFPSRVATHALGQAQAGDDLADVVKQRRRQPASVAGVWRPGQAALDASSNLDGMVLVVGREPPPQVELRRLQKGRGPGLVGRARPEPPEGRYLTAEQVREAGPGQGPGVSLVRAHAQHAMGAGASSVFVKAWT